MAGFDQAAATETMPSSVNPWIQGLLSGGLRWANRVGGVTELSYSFPFTGGPNRFALDYGAEPTRDPSGLTALQQQNVAAALNAWAEVAKLRFVRVEEVGTEVGDLRFAFTSDMDRYELAHAYLPSAHPAGGDVWVNAASRARDFAKGSDDYLTLLHEIGHALGLKHPGEGTRFPAMSDLLQYTVMGIYSGGTPSTPMVYDILAIQHLYGANMTTRTGNDVYRFDAQMRDQAIWDAGGLDTLDFSALTIGANINLEAGANSRIATPGGTRILGIAFGVGIENVVGGSGNDFITLNALANKVTAGAGDDIIQATLLGDEIDGGDGRDRFNLAGASRDYLAMRTSRGDSLFKDGQITVLANVEDVGFDVGSNYYDGKLSSAATLNALRYIASYADLRAGFGTNAAAGGDHFVNTGWREARRISFDAVAYIASHADLIRAFGTDYAAGAAHYIRAGAAEGRATSFDAWQYIAANPDRLRYGFDPIGEAAADYVSVGFAKGLATSGFDSLGYICSYADLRAAFGSDANAALRHFVNSGRYEGRSVSFDPLNYIASHADLRAAFGANSGAGYAHFLSSGATERRTISFDGLRYIASHGDLITAFGADERAGAAHYIVAGAAEGRGVSFDAAAYLSKYFLDIAPSSRTAEGAMLHFIRSGFAAGKSDSLAGDDRVYAGIGSDVLRGGAGNDILFGDYQNPVSDPYGGAAVWGESGGDDRLLGEDGNDQLFGGLGRDTLIGGNGGDWLDGQGDKDILIGGAGADVFAFGARYRNEFSMLFGDSGADSIIDFNPLEDRIGLRVNVELGSFAALAGLTAAQFFRAGFEAADADDRILYDAETGRLLYDSDGTGSASAILLATLAPNLSLTADHFLIYS